MLVHARIPASPLVHRSWNTSWRRRLAGHCRMSRKFGPWDIDQAEIFTETELSFAFVNLKPVVPGAASWRASELLLARQYTQSAILLGRSPACEPQTGCSSLPRAQWV